MALIYLNDYDPILEMICSIAFCVPWLLTCKDVRQKFFPFKSSSTVDSRRKPLEIRISSVVDCRRIWAKIKMKHLYELV